VRQDGSVLLTTPSYVSEGVAEKFIREKIGWLTSKIIFFKNLADSPTEKRISGGYLKYKDDAHALIERKVEYFNNVFGYRYNRISIKDQKTCWGSCSKWGNLNFNYKILFLSETLQDYIVVHELCHLKELNHSKRFWNLVAKTIPDYQDNRNELKKNRVNFRSFLL
jgi:predicted metal-dependent hydrolase